MEALKLQLFSQVNPKNSNQSSNLSSLDIELVGKIKYGKSFNDTTVLQSCQWNPVFKAKWKDLIGGSCIYPLNVMEYKERIVEAKDSTQKFVFTTLTLGHATEVGEKEFKVWDWSIPFEFVKDKDGVHWVKPGKSGYKNSLEVQDVLKLMASALSQLT